VTRSWLLRPLALVIVLGGSHVALAEAEEHRLGVSASGVVASAAAAGATTSAPQGALELKYAHGVNNWLSVGGELFFAAGPSLSFDNALVDDQPGELRATMYTGGVAAVARAEAGVDVSKVFAITHPYVSLGVGALSRTLSNQQLIDPDSGLLVLAPATSFDVRPYASFELGLEHRFGAGVAGALALGGRYAGDAYAAGEVRLELAWYWY
jgi:hypothetical protein